MSEPVVEVLSADEIAARRDALVARLRMPLPEARARARDYTLSEREAALVREINGLDWLAGRRVTFSVDEFFAELEADDDQAL